MTSYLDSLAAPAVADSSQPRDRESPEAAPEALEQERIVIAPQQDARPDADLRTDRSAPRAVTRPSPLPEQPSVAQRSTASGVETVEAYEVAAPGTGSRSSAEPKRPVARVAPIADTPLPQQKSDRERPARRPALPQAYAPAEMRSNAIAMQPLERPAVSTEHSATIVRPLVAAVRDRVEDARAISPTAPAWHAADARAAVEVHIGAIEVTLNGRPTQPPAAAAPLRDPDPAARNVKRERPRFAFHPGRHHLRWS